MARTLWVIAVVVVGCRGGEDPRYERGAREAIVKAATCPADRVTVTRRADLKPYDLLVGRHDPPPADIAADPGRLAVWNKKQQETEDGYNQDHVFETSGCGKHVFYVCGLGEGSNQSQVVVCRDAVHPPAK